MTAIRKKIAGDDRSVGRRRRRRHSSALLLGLLSLALAPLVGIAADPPPAETQPAKPAEADVVQCANLVYAGVKSSVCFSDKFLDTVRRETYVKPELRFQTVKLAEDALFDFPFAVITGEGAFSMQEKERERLRAYLERGGFLLASAGCSSRDWDRSFRQELKKIFPDNELKKLEMDHPVFHTVFEVKEIKLKKGGKAQLEGLEIDGKIVMIYSSEGLNDTGNVNGCCCCGGNEVLNCQEINVNIISYALTH
jgi:hypothetical protein